MTGRNEKTTQTPNNFPDVKNVGSSYTLGVFQLKQAVPESVKRYGAGLRNRWRHI